MAFVQADDEAGLLGAFFRHLDGWGVLAKGGLLKSHSTDGIEVALVAQFGCAV
jgi:hypothetical protein